MKTLIRTFAIVSVLATGFTVSALAIHQHDADSSLRSAAPLDIACAAGEINSGCHNNGTYVQLGTIVVTPTLSERHYLASHDYLHHMPMPDSDRLTPAQAARRAETG